MQWPFKRKTKSSGQDLPAEIQDYYQSARKERRGIAALLAVGTLVATILICLGLFFGGRWVFRKLHHPAKPAPAQPAAQTADTGQSSEPEPESEPAEQSPATSPAPPRQHSNLPNTGPADMVFIFLLTSLLSGAVYYRWHRPHGI